MANLSGIFNSLAGVSDELLGGVGVDGVGFDGGGASETK